MKIKKRWNFSRLLIVVFIVSAAPALAYSEADYASANQSLLAAIGGDKSAIPDAVEKFGVLSKTEPTNPLLLVNFGAMVSMQSRTTVLPWKKISYAEDGMASQDKAVAMLTPEHDKQKQGGAPVSLLVKYVAANTFLAVPGFFNRETQGSKLIKEVLASPLLEGSDMHFKGTVWMRAARWSIDQKRPEDAKRYLNMVIDSNAPQAEAAKMQLQVL